MSENDDTPHDETAASNAIGNFTTCYAVVNASGGFEAEAFFDRDEALLSASMHHEPFGVVEMLIPERYEDAPEEEEKPKTRKRTTATRKAPATK